MKKIIVPTDFSKSAGNAYDYARALVDHLEYQIKVVNVCHPNTDAVNGIQIPSMGELLKFHQDKLDEFVFADPSDSVEGVVADTMVEKEVYIGFASEVLINLSKEEDTELMVMGTSGKGGILEKVFGSISSKVSKHGHCPIWLIPPKAKFNGIKNIMYASNYQSADDALIQKIIDFAGIFDANIHMVHVTEDKNEKDFQLEEVLIEQLFRRKASSLEFRMSTIKSKSVWEGLYSYADANQIDLIVMVNRHRNFWESLLHKSTIEAMVFHAQTPLLIVHTQNS